MATPSTIIIVSDKKVTSQYCHFDGGLNNVGFILANHYNDIEKVKKLSKKGGINSLKENIKDSIFYKDLLCPSLAITKIFKSVSQAIKNADTQYIYVYYDYTWHTVVGDFLVPLQQQIAYPFIEDDDLPM